MREPCTRPSSGEPTRVDLWAWRTVPAPGEAVAAEDLSADERERARGFHRRADATRFIMARAGMRRGLASYVGVPAAALRFKANAWGKPSLDGLARSPRFNLSHADDWAALAVCWEAEVGLDIEAVRPVEASVAQGFSAAERSALAGLAPGDAWLKGFYRCWTRKEAVVKALGVGLSLPLDGFDVSLDPAEPPRLLRLEGDPDAPRRWTLLHLSLPDAVLGAVALPVPRCELVLRHAPPRGEASEARS